MAEGSTPQEMYEDANQQLTVTRQEVDTNRGAARKLKEFKKYGHARKCCPLCARDMNAQQLTVFDETVGVY